MTKSRGIRKQHKEGDIKIFASNNTKWRYTNGKWVYIKKPKDERHQVRRTELIKSLYMEGKTYDEITKIVKCSKNTVTRYCQELKFKFPPIKLPDHIKPTNYPYYYISNDGIAYREPRQIDVFGKYGKVNEYGLIQLTTHLRGNPNHGEEFMYDGINIYFYDKTGKNVGYKKRNIHQLVAETWIPNPHEYNEVLHGKKGNRCNHVDNLRWGTHAENMKESSNTLPEGAIRYHNRNATHYDGCKRSPTKYVKKDGKWVLIPSDKPVWNKGLRSGVADGTLKKCLNGYWKVKEDGKWNHLKQKDYAKYNIKTDI